MPINKDEITKEMLEKAMQCKTAEELMAFAKAEGIELSIEEAEAYLSELEDFELDGEHLRDRRHCKARNKTLILQSNLFDSRGSLTNFRGCFL